MYEPVEDEISLAAGQRPIHTNGTYQKGASRVVHSTMVKKL
ncbi:hypothetical protein WJX82_001922 [Trebouxia sp. C0006]